MIDNFFIWDKESPINGNNAEDVLNSDNAFKNNTVVFFTEKGIPRQHDFVENLRKLLDMESESDIEVCNKRLNEIMKQQNEQKQEALNLQKQQQEIEALKKQNAELSYLIMQQQGGAL